MSTIFLTHIPKTAGTSIRRSVFDPHISSSVRFSPNGYRSALTTRREFRLVDGHFPYGIHYLLGVDSPQYFVMLRNPVDRAISHYYFIKSCEGPFYTHPRIEDVRQNNLVDFYQTISRHQNVQTRFIAGVGWEFAGRHMSSNGWWGQWALQRAKWNLENRYIAFGLKEQFKASARLFSSIIGVQPEWTEKRHKATPDRPLIGDLSEEARRSLRRANSLDMELYSFAVDLFKRRISGA
jgi:hypothetical protein